MPENPMRIYVYRGCDTCKKALKFLDGRGMTYEAIPIREQPPTVPELRRMLELTGSMRRLFNTSGGDYKAMDLASRLPGLTENEALDLLSRHGNLVKRPFLLTADGRGTTGFKEEEWGKLFPARSGGS
jgi:arsenate reductase